MTVLLKKNEHRTSNVQHRILQRQTSVEWENDEETEIVIQGSTSDF